jgi:uncharacterized membrane protein YhaH (DUF805 family)
MSEAFTTCMRNSADFSGRARRSEYWWFYLALQLIVLPCAIAYVVVVMLAGADVGPDDGLALSGADFAPTVVLFGLMIVVSLAFTLPSYAAMARRLHDMAQSGLWILLNFAGLGIVSLVMCITDTPSGA